MASAKLRPYNKLPSPLLSVFLLTFFMLFKRHFSNLTSLLVLLIQDKYGISPYFGSKGGAVVRAFASHQCGQGSNYVLRRYVWVDFVVGSLLCSESFLSGNG